MISIYLGAENIALTQRQKDSLRTTLAAIGPVDHPQPAELMHWRQRLDGDATIMRSLFDEKDLTNNGLRQLLATAISVPVEQITATSSYITYAQTSSTIVLMSIAGVDQMRFILFGGLRAEIRASNIEVLAYLKINAAAWGDA